MFTRLGAPMLLLLLLFACTIRSGSCGSLSQLFFGPGDDEDDFPPPPSDRGDNQPKEPELVQGIRATFWNNVTKPEFTSKAFEGKPPVVSNRLMRDVYFKFYKQESFPDVYHEHFAGIFTGYLLPPRTGIYRFDLEGDDIVSLKLGGDRCYNKAQQRTACSISLLAGHRIAVELRYYQEVGPASIVLSWECMPHFHRTLVPPSAYRALKHVQTANEGAAGGKEEL